MLRKERCIVIKDVRNFKELRNMSQKVFVAVFIGVKNLSAMNFLKMVRKGSEFDLVHPDWVMLCKGLKIYLGMCHKKSLKQFFTGVKNLFFEDGEKRFGI